MALGTAERRLGEALGIAERRFQGLDGAERRRAEAALGTAERRFGGFRSVGPDHRSEPATSALAGGSATDSR